MIKRVRQLYLPPVNDMHAVLCEGCITKTLCQPKIEDGEHNKKPTEMARPDNADALCGRCISFGNESQRAPGERAPRRLSADLRTLFKNACVFEGESNRRGSTKDENRTLISDILLKQSDIFALQKLYCSLCSQLYSICSCNLKLPKAISLRSNITELAQ